MTKNRHHVFQKIMAVMLVQACLVMDVAWAGGVAYCQRANQNQLNPSVAIQNEQFTNTFASGYEDVIADPKAIYIDGRQQSVSVLSLVKQFFKDLFWLWNSCCSALISVVCWPGGNPWQGRGGIPRRKFLQITPLAIVGAVVGLGKAGHVFAGAEDKVDPDVSARLDFNELKTLSRRQGKEYFKNLGDRIEKEQILRDRADEFLRKVFEEGLPFWMREEAIQLLIRHGYIGFEEAKEIVNTTPDGKTVQSIYDVLAEKPTEKILFYLRERIQKEAPAFINYLAYESALKNAIKIGMSIPQKLIDEIITADKKEQWEIKEEQSGIITSSMSERLLEMYKRQKEMDKRRIKRPLLGVIARNKNNPQAYEILMKEINRIERSKEPYPAFLLCAVGMARTQEAEDVLQKLSKDPAAMRERADGIIDGLLELDTLTAKKRIIELIDEIKSPRTLGRMARAIAKMWPPESTRPVFKALIGRLEREVNSNLEGEEETLTYLADALGFADPFPEVENCLLEMSRDPREKVRRAGASGLGNLGTAKAEQRLLEMSRDPEQGNIVKSVVVIALGDLGTEAARKRLQEIHEESLRTGDRRVAYLAQIALARYGSHETVEWLISQRILMPHTRTYEDIAPYIFSLVGYRSVGLLRSKLLDAEGETAKKIIMAIKGIVYSTGRDLRELNQKVNDDVPSGEAQTAIFVKRLKKYPEILFVFLALSQAVTSHSFPLIYSYFQGYAQDTYGTEDTMRYIREEFGNHFLMNYLFTATLFRWLGRELKNSRYSPEALAGSILSEDNMPIFFWEPVLFAKIVIGVLKFCTDEYKNAFVNKMRALSGKHNELRLMLKLLVDDGSIKEEMYPGLGSVIAGVSLPPINPVWQGPQQKLWLDEEGNLNVNLYWSTIQKAELNHYKAFCQLFTSKKGYYESKLEKSGADMVLVKKFPRTRRQIKIHLYSSLDKIKESIYPITISRGHAGEEGNSDYPGVEGGARMGLECRALNNAGLLVGANPENATITTTDTGRAIENNEVLYWMLEYLGGMETWGDWRQVKKFIWEAIPEGHKFPSDKYNFPSDDISLKYAVYLKIMQSGWHNFFKETALGAGAVISGTTAVETLKKACSLSEFEIIDEAI